MPKQDEFLSFQRIESPDASLFPQNVLDGLKKCLDTLRFDIPRCAAPLRAIIGDDDPKTYLVHWDWYEADEGFVASISVNLIRLFYNLFVAQEAAFPDREPPCIESYYAAQHPRARMFAEALTLLCRDARPPTPWLRQIIEPNSSEARRAALDVLARQISAKQHADGELEFVPAAFFNTMVAVQALLFRDYYHLAFGIPLLRSLLETRQWDVMSPKAFNWCAALDADIFAAKAVSSLFPKNDVCNTLFLDFRDDTQSSRDLNVRFAPNEIRVLRLVYGLLHLQSAFAKEQRLAARLLLPRKEYAAACADLRRADDVPPFALPMAHIHEVLWREANPHIKDEQIDLEGRHVLRSVCDQYLIASAQWLGDTSLLALGALPIHDLEAREAENDFVTAYMPIYRKLRKIAQPMLSASPIS